MSPEWTRLLTDEDEWVVRTALSNVIADLRQFVIGGDDDTLSSALRESLDRYRITLERIERA